MPGAEVSADAGSDTSESSDRGLLDPRLPAPNFFIVGAAKAGTTSLHAYLARHPDVFMSPVKEPHYFAAFQVTPEHDNFVSPIRDSREYQELFRGSERCLAVGEASPSYLCDPDAATRIRSAVPGARIIISLRDPVQRAHSHYLMERRQGRETRPFKEALDADLLRNEKGWGVSFQYVELGQYASQVERYMRQFGRSNVLIVSFEDLTSDTARVMGEIARFLGIDPAAFPEAAFDQVHNPYEESRGTLARLLLRSHFIRTWSKRCVPRRWRSLVRNRLLFMQGRKPELDDECRRFLAAIYAPDIDRLERILGRDLHVLRKSW